MSQVFGIEGESEIFGWGERSDIQVVQWNGRCVRPLDPNEAVTVVRVKDLDYNVHAEVSIKFGGSSEPEVTWGVGGSVGDSRGNSVGVDVQRNSDGSTDLKGSVDHGSSDAPEAKK